MKHPFDIFIVSALVFFIIPGCGGGGTASNSPPPAEESLNINTLGWVDSPWISRDGTKMYFMYSRYNFYPVFYSTPELPRLEGPERDGHNSVDANPYWDSDIYVSTKTAGGWTEPVHLGFNDYWGDCCHIFVNNFSRVYYTKENGSNGTDLYYIDIDTDGNAAGSLTLIPNVNSTENEDNPHVSAGEISMWFTSSRAGGQGGKDIWFSAYSGGQWQAPVNLGPTINTAADEDQFWVSETTNAVYFNRDAQIYTSTWDGMAFSTPTHVDLGFPYVGEASLPDDASVLYFAVSDPGTERIKIYSSVNNFDGTFQTPIPLD